MTQLVQIDEVVNVIYSNYQRDESLARQREVRDDGEGDLLAKTRASALRRVPPVAAGERGPGSRMGVRSERCRSARRKSRAGQRFAQQTSPPDPCSATSRRVECAAGAGGGTTAIGALPARARERRAPKR